MGVPALVAQQQGVLGGSPTTQASPVAAVPRLSPEHMAKLYGELDVVQGNLAVMSEMLSELKPGKEHPSDMELLKVTTMLFISNIAKSSMRISKS